MTEKEKQHSNRHVSNFQVNIKERIHHGYDLSDVIQNFGYLIFK